MDLECLKINRRREVEHMQKMINKLQKQYNQFGFGKGSFCADQSNLNTSIFSIETQRIDFEKKLVDWSHHSILLEKELKQKDEEITNLVKKVNKAYHGQKQPSFDKQAPTSNKNENTSLLGVLPISNFAENLEPKIDELNRLNTQDTRLQTMETLRARSEKYQKFYSTYSQRLENGLISSRKKDKTRQRTYRRQEKLNNQISRDESSNLINIDDSLSDVPVKEDHNMIELGDFSQNLSLEEQEPILDSLS